MNFLQLAQQVRSKCGISGTGPATVAAQPGEMGRVVDWTNEAWLDIQNRHGAWHWMRGEFSLQTVAGERAYLPADLGIDDLRYWHTETLRCWRTADGQAGEQYMTPLDYGDFRNMYMFGAMNDQAQQPNLFAVRPRDRALLLGPKPDGVYTVAGEFQRAARRMVNPLDLPGGGLYPVEYEMLIVWLAVQKYAGYEGAGALYQVATAQANALWPGLVRDQLDDIELGAPLA
jgi:hypothetical protein